LTLSYVTPACKAALIVWLRLQVALRPA